MYLIFQNRFVYFLCSINKCIVLLLLVFLSKSISAQKIYGVIRNEKGDPLPYSSVIIKGTSKGVSSNNKAEYALTVSSGTYVILCQHIGYESMEKKVDVSGDINIDFSLKEQQLMMKEVVIKKGEDPAYEIIRQAIKKRDFYANQVNGFSCDLYGKDVIKLRNLPEKIMGQKITKENKSEMGVDTTGKGIVYLSESVSKIFSQRPDKFKMDVMSSRVSGSNSFGFTFPAFITLYANNVSIFSGQFNSRGFVSPIADGALRFYRFKFKGTFFEDGKAINAIQVIPRRQYEPLFSGTINITDGDWRIHSFDLMLTKTSQLEIIDTLSISQLHVPVSKDIWQVKNQLLHFNLNLFKIDAIGNFLSVYSSYDINPEFDKKTFGKVLIKYDSVVDKHSKQYWDSSRPVPLDAEEQKDYLVKDSLFSLTLDSNYWKNNIDSLKKKQGKIKPFKILFEGITRTRYSKTNQFKWGILPLIAGVSYNTAEGLLMEASGFYDKKFEKSSSRLLIRPNIRYGFSNTHWNGFMDIEFRAKESGNSEKYDRSRWLLSSGKRVSQYNKDIPVLPLVNTISTLQSGLNVMKTYENNFFDFGYKRKLENGLSLSGHILYEDRLPIFNTTNYTFRKKDTVRITENYPTERVESGEIIRHQAAIVSVEISFKPGQKYIQFPDRKVSIGSNYPTFSFSYTKGIKRVFGSDVDFDKWMFSIRDDKNLKLAGTLKYKFAAGGFLNRSKVFIQDYFHFNANSLNGASEYVNSFQLTSSYANSTTENFYALGHMEHHFNGLLTNKIPLFKKLNWNLVAGANAFFINPNKQFVEVFAGIENIFKIFRVDYVTAYKNGKYSTSAIVIGAGGVLGGSTTNPSQQRRGLGISF